MNTVITLFLSLLTLTLLEIVLGIDNLVFIAIASSRLPVSKQKAGRRLGLIFALVTRLLLLAGAVWLISLNSTLFTISNHTFSVRDLILIGGGLFLLGKTTQEIHREMEPDLAKPSTHVYATVITVATQIGILDIIFSFDSIFTAVGLTQHYWVMATAIVIAMLAMLFLSEPLSKLIKNHPTIKMLAFSFLLLIGVLLLADGFHYSIERKYIYFAICFATLVELLNNLAKRRNKN